MEYLEKTESMLNEGSMIERIGSFIPPLRPGFSETKHEISIQKKVAKKLYSKRVQLAEKMSSSPEKDTRGIVYPALISCGISPHSVQKYEEYIELLATRQGGWTRWKSRVSDECAELNAEKRKIAIPASIFITIMFVSLLFSFVGVAQFPDSTYYFIIPLTIAVCGITYGTAYVYPLLSHGKKSISRIAGENNKPVKDFLPATKVM